MLYDKVVTRLVRDGTLRTDERILVVCGGSFDRDVLKNAGFKDVTIANLDTSYEHDIQPFAWDRQDAEHLSYSDASFDVVIVHAGLHHCYSPHRGLLEMLRVARHGALVFEARDGLFLNIAKRLGFTSDYEIEAVSAGGYVDGGVANTPIPNFIYRWTENEVLKTVRSAEPRFEPAVRFFHGLRLPHQGFSRIDRPFFRYALLVIAPIAHLAAMIFKRQGNEFGFWIEKSTVPHPWLENKNGEVVMNRLFVERAGRVYRPVSK